MPDLEGTAARHVAKRGVDRGLPDNRALQGGKARQQQPGALSAILKPKRRHFYLKAAAGNALRGATSVACWLAMDYLLPGGEVVKCSPG